MTGYAIRQQFQQTPIARYSSSPGSIYPALHRLQSMNLISPISTEKRDGFELTADGRKLLREWLLRPVDRAQMENDDETLLLRFAFMSDLVPPSATRKFLEAFGREAEACASRLTELGQDAESTMPLSGRLALDRGIETFRAHARWAKQALKSVASSR